MDFVALSRLPDACAEHSDSVVDGLLERVEIALLLKWRPKRWPIKCAGEHCKGLLVIDVLKRIDEIAQLDFAIGKRNALDQAPQEKFGSKPEMLLELGTGPDRYFMDPVSRPPSEPRRDAGPRQRCGI